jgi:predicted nucleic acid-binding protein
MGQIIGMLNAMRGHRVYVDTNVFIYFLESHPEFFAAAAPVILGMHGKQFHGFTGEIAVAETMVGPYRTNNPIIISNTRNFFGAAHFLTILPHDTVIFDHAAQLRARQRMKFVDAVHIATALHAACEFFITNDKTIRSVDTLNIVQLTSLLP